MRCLRSLLTQRLSASKIWLSVSIKYNLKKNNKDILGWWIMLSDSSTLAQDSVSSVWLLTNKTFKERLINIKRISLLSWEIYVGRNWHCTSVLENLPKEIWIQRRRRGVRNSEFISGLRCQDEITFSLCVLKKQRTNLARRHKFTDGSKYLLDAKWVFISRRLETAVEKKRSIIAWKHLKTFFYVWRQDLLWAPQKLNEFTSRYIPENK